MEYAVSKIGAAGIYALAAALTSLAMADGATKRAGTTRIAPRADLQTEKGASKSMDTSC